MPESTDEKYFGIDLKKCNPDGACPYHKDLAALIKELEDDRELNVKIRQYATAMGMIYPLAISLDYKNDSYQMIEYDNFLNKTAARSGNIDELIRVGASTIPDKTMAEDFWNLFNRESVIDAFKQGKKEIALRHTQNGDDGKIHYMDTKVICIECSDERIDAVSISKCIDEEMERDRATANEVRHAEIITSLSTIYTTIMEANLKTHGYSVIKSVDLMKTATGGNEDGNFDLVVESVLEHFMAPESRDDMRKFLNLGTLAERLENKDTILTTYKNPQGFWFESRFIAHKKDENGHVISAIYVARDITAEKQKELRYNEKLREAAIEADKANISKTNFLRRMSHDIRTPLNGIVGMLNISKRYKDDREKYDECIEKIANSANYLLDLVNNVLDISKLESGSLVLEHKPFDLGQLLLNTLPLVITYAGENSIAFEGGREDSHMKHRYVIGSPVHLNRVLMNIASNAIKYNRPGGSLKIYCNEIESDEDTATYEFVCEDTGLGMSEEFQRHAFEPFAQEGKQTVTSFSGSGLGLSIVKDIVEMMGGTISLKSKENEGTTIKIILKLPLDKERSHSGDTEKTGLEKIDVSGKKALLVEDNGINMEIAKIILEEVGFEVTCAGDGLEALNIFRESEPYAFDCIFMDVMMPVMDGIEATKEIRALERPDAKTVPIIAMTANAFAEDRQMCFDAGMNDHVSKPIDMIALNNAIRKIEN